jgi:hypothetical protein
MDNRNFKNTPCSSSRKQKDGEAQQTGRTRTRVYGSDTAAFNKLS